MAVRFLSYPKFHAEDGNGKPLVGGKLNVYAAGTTDRIDTWTDFDQTSKNTNPVILNSRGEADVFFDAPAKLVLTDKNDVTIWTLDDISPLNAQTLTGKYNLVQNGSFELDGDGDGVPDSWDVVETTDTSTVEIDTGSVAHGTQALKFASAGGGGGTATTSSKFPVSDGDTVGVSFFVTSTSVTATNKVDLITYDKSGGNPVTQNVYTSSGTAPTSFEQKAFSASIPVGKTQAELKLTGVDNAVTATTYFDFVQVLDQGYIFNGAAGEVTASAADMNAVLTPYATATVELGGDFNTQDVQCERIGNTVTITGSLVVDGDVIRSTSGIIPSQFRPTSTLNNLYDATTTHVCRCEVTSSGTLILNFFDWQGGSNFLTALTKVSISYLVNF